MKFNLNFVSELNQFTCNKMFFSDKCQNIDGQNGHYPAEKQSAKSSFGKNDELERYLSIFTCWQMKKKGRGRERKRPMIYFGNARKQAVFFQGWITEHFVRNRLFFRHLHQFLLELIRSTPDKRIAEIILNIIDNAMQLR